jgi:hypothetical protein
MPSQLWQFGQDKALPLAPTLLIVSHCIAHTVIMTITYEIHVGNCMVTHQAIQNIKPAVPTVKEIVLLTTSLLILQPTMSRKVPQGKRCSRS